MSLLTERAAVAHRTAPEIVGRETELARLDAFVSSLDAGARALVIRGEPGIGKTALWREALERCRRAGFAVLVTRPVEEEMPLALVGLADLFDGVELAAAGLGPASDPVVRGRAVLDALRQLAAQQPVVVAVDDAQWLDPVSARALRFCLRRLDTEPVGLLTTLRQGTDVADPLAPETLLPRERCETLDVGPLSMGALRRVVGRVVATISRPTLKRVHEVSGGNPLYALELARGLQRDPDVAGATAGLRLPDSLRAAVSKRLRTVPVELAPLLEVASALGASSVQELRQALPGHEVDGLLAVASDHELLVVGDDLRVELSHPIVGSVVYEQIGALERRALHARLAKSATDPDERARHVALSTDEPAAEVADLLEEAAARAAASGAFELAAEFTGHSLRLTPPEDEAAMQRRAMAEIERLAAAGEVGRALAQADRLVATLSPGAARAEALVLRAQLEVGDPERGEELLVRALEEAGGDDLLRARVLDQLGWLRGQLLGDVRAGVVDMREALEIAEREHDPELEMSAASGLASVECLAGVSRRDLHERAVALEAEIGRPLLWGGPRHLLATDLRLTGELAGARELLEAVHAECLTLGNERWRPHVLHGLVLVEWQAGDLARAEELLGQALEAARDDEDATAVHSMQGAVAVLAVHRGRPDEARSIIEQLLESAEQNGRRAQGAQARTLLGALSLALGDPVAAARDLADAVEVLQEMGYANPAVAPAYPLQVEALAGSGELDAAQRILEVLERQVETLDNDLARAVLDRCRGAVALAGGDPRAALAPLERSVASLDRLGYRLEAALSVLVLGRAFLRAGQRSNAAEALADARDRFASMGARLWQERAAEELERAAPGRGTGELTPAERRVAALVTEGAKNREIGQALFMSIATVEAHLTRIYRKLGIRSRSELARLVATGDIAVVDEDDSSGEPSEGPKARS